MQSASASYQQLDADNAKRPDMIVAIAGYPRLFSCVSSSYTVPASGDLSTASGFSTVYAWARFPDIAATKVKGAFPEGGAQEIGNCDIEILDKHGESTISRDLTELLSRQAFIEDVQTGTETTLSDNPLAKAATTINLASTSGLSAGGTIWIGQEAIKIGTVASGTQLTGCTRGYLLTNDQRHETGVIVYGYCPSVLGRTFYVYKGYQDLGLGSWLKAWSGTIVDGFLTAPGVVKIQAKPNTWLTWGGSAKGRPNPFNTPRRGRTPSFVNARKIVRLGELSDEDEPLSASATEIAATSFPGDFSVSVRIKRSVADATDFANRLGDGHHLLRFGDSWVGLASVDTIFNSGGYTTAVYNAVRIGTSPGEAAEERQEVKIGWTNATLSNTTFATGSDPIELALQLLTSTGTGTNGDYDDFRKGIGLAIAVENIDLTSFTNVQAEYDYDDAMRVFFIFEEPTDAKAFIEEELLKPLGCYLGTGNDGKIKLVRPKNPNKLYFSKANNVFVFTMSNAPNDPRTFVLPGGVYTKAQAASALQAGFIAVSGVSTITVLADPGGPFYVDTGSATTIEASSSDAWSTLGFTSGLVAGISHEAGTIVGYFSDTSTFGVQTITKNDILSGSLQNGGGEQISRINWAVNYDWSEEEFTAYHPFVDAEIENLSPFEQSAPYTIEAKGFLRAFAQDKSTRINTPFTVRLPPDGNQSRGITVDASSSIGIDASNSYAALLSMHLFDRYRNPPPRLKVKVKWRFNTLEIGDEVLFSHDVDGASLDPEYASASFDERLFEVTGARPIMHAGQVCVELDLLAHRATGSQVCPAGSTVDTEIFRGTWTTPGADSWGSRISTAFRVESGIQQREGMPLISREGIVRADSGVSSNGIQDGSITVDKLTGQPRDALFAGGGRDGEADFDGTSTVLGVVPSGSVYTLTRGISATRMHVRSGVTIKGGGYIIQARELHLWGTAIIQRDGAAGTDGSTITGGPKADGAGSVVIGGSADSGAGGNAGTAPGEAGANGVAGNNATNGYGGGGGAGGNGSAGSLGGGAAGSGQAGGTVAALLAVSTTDLTNITRLMLGTDYIRGGAGGGGAGGGGASGPGTDGGAGGSGGAGGGVLLVLCDQLILHSWTGRISANGGAGGNGASGDGDGGGGGGGGGGFAQVVYNSISGGTLVASPLTRNGATVSGANVTANGGAAGTKAGGASDGTAGTNGLVVIVGPELFIPVAERPPIIRQRPIFQIARLHPGHIYAMTRHRSTT